MKSPIRLLAAVALDGESIAFDALFAVPAADQPEVCAPAELHTGDGEVIELGLLCAPTPFTWRTQQRIKLGSHRYRDDGAHIASLHWGEVTAEVTVAPEMFARGDISGQPAIERPTVMLFAVNAVAHTPHEQRVRLEVAELSPSQRVRLDGGAGQAFWLSRAETPNLASEWLLDYPKLGSYTVAVDLIDADGFWLTTLAEMPIEIIPPPEFAYPGQPHEAAVETPAPVEPPVAVELAVAEQPWLPYRYCRPTWASTLLYRQPGGSTVSRTVWSGTYLSIRAETAVGGQRWFLTAGGDWVAASNVTLMEPSDLRGVELGGGVPPPPQPPPASRRGVVTADVLNVRARPGVTADNPPIGQLRSGTEVDIYEETTYGGAVWYRIGEGRWVHSGWVRLIETTPAPPPTPPPPPVSTRRGVVTASVLNVRAQAGVRPDNPPIGVLHNGAEVTIYEEASSGGAVWYRIGANRWVHSGWVRITSSNARAMREVSAESSLGLPIGWIVAVLLDVRARPGTAADNPPISSVRHNLAVPVLEEATVGSSRWVRIGEGQWVDAAWVGVARMKPRPSTISAAERWVAVNLKEQTAVAYEGDRPVYAALVATGLPGTPTVQGIFRTWLRLDTGVMAGSGYYIEDVTWTCYFYSGYALHTTYWHDAFGRPRSHGCVNLSPYDAWWIYRWSAAGGPNSPAVYVYWS
jgi:L,D-transpeptidase catalytic domain/Bacterial SH3 domain